MAKQKELPQFLKKRKIMFGEKFSNQARSSVGVEFMDAGRYDDALEFFVRSDSEEFAREIAEIAWKDCNVPVFLRAKVVLKEKPDGKELERLAERALEIGRPSMAALAFQKAGFDEKARQVRAETLGGKNAGEEGAAGAVGVET